VQVQNPKDAHKETGFQNGNGLRRSQVFAVAIAKVAKRSNIKRLNNDIVTSDNVLNARKCSTTPINHLVPVLSKDGKAAQQNTHRKVCEEIENLDHRRGWSLTSTRAKLSVFWEEDCLAWVS
jgi:hypothetical protein